MADPQVFRGAFNATEGKVDWAPVPKAAGNEVHPNQTVVFLGAGGDVHLTFTRDSPFPPNQQSPAAPLSYEGNPVVLVVRDDLKLQPGERRPFPFQCGIRINGELRGLDRAGDEMEVVP